MSIEDIGRRIRAGDVPPYLRARCLQGRQLVARRIRTLVTEQLTEKQRLQLFRRRPCDVAEDVPTRWLKFMVGRIENDIRVDKEKGYQLWRFVKAQF
jgi:hypothetical protein